MPTDRKGSAAITTVDATEIEKFNEETNWWSINGGRKLLYTFNNVRIPFLIKCLIKLGRLDEAAEKSAKPLKGLKILDAGCGGGFLSEALANFGAETTGLDAADNLIAVAKEHKHTLDPSVKLEYVTSTIEEFSIKNKNTFDVVFSSEVIEHVSNPEEFVSKCVDCVKPGGSIVFTTIDRNIFSRIFMLWFSEYMTGIIPLGTHQYEKFVTPDELTAMLKSNSCIPQDIEGCTFNPLTKQWFVIPTTKLNYAIHAVKSFK